MSESSRSLPSARTFYDEVAGWVAQAPDRLAGLASVDLRDPVRAVRELYL